MSQTRAVWSHVKRTVYRGSCAARLPDVARWRNRHHLLVLTYHGLRCSAPPPGFSWPLLHVDSFASQLSYLKDRYRIAPIDDAIQELLSGGLSEPTACITFDDGYRSNFTLGLDVLQRYAAPATIYLATGLIGTNRILWTAELDLAFQQTTRHSVDLRPLEPGIVRLGSVMQRAVLARRVIDQLKALQRGALTERLAAVRTELEVPTPEHGGAYGFMSWDEVKTMEESGLIRFGAHTVNHEIVARLNDRELSEEIVNSINTVQQRVRKPSATFAYPNGTRTDFDERAVAVLRTCGCAGAVSTIEGLNDRRTDAFALRRFNIGSELSMDEFRLLTSGALPRRARTQD
jgi:peptidoglycan/xylan/chitin deacetylase (PgdA/CDA1 family)